MPEYLDIVDENGQPTGETIERSIAHQKGILHKSVHIWIMNDLGEVILQKRSPSKKINPNKWTSSAAGHMEAGETVLEAAKKEICEEVGLEVTDNHLKKLFSYKSKLVGDDYIEHEFKEVYLCHVSYQIEDIKIQEEEVSEVIAIPVAELKKMFAQAPETFSDYSGTYFEQVITHLETYLHTLNQ